MTIPKNIKWHPATITRQHRENQNGHKGMVIWFTGLSGAGKSTLAHALEERLFAFGCHSYVFDGDNIRHGLNKDLGFSPEARLENVRRIGEVVKLFLEAGVIAITAFISPYARDRHMVRTMIGEADFAEVYCRCSLETCEARDAKGRYKAAREGAIPEFTGISAPYEAPEDPELAIDTENKPVEDCVEEIVEYLARRGVFPIEKLGRRTVV
jgi:adenylylsulfate kinase